MEPKEQTKIDNPHVITCTADEITLADFITLVHLNAVAHGFWEDGPRRNSGEQIALIHSELSEALEAMRNGDPPDEHCPQFGNVVIELADAVIRICDMTEGSATNLVKGTFLGAALIAKHNANCLRPHKHGKEF